MVVWDCWEEIIRSWVLGGTKFGSCVLGGTKFVSWVLGESNFVVEYWKEPNFVVGNCWEELNVKFGRNYIGCLLLLGETILVVYSFCSEFKCSFDFINESIVLFRFLDSLKYFQVPF